MPDDPETQMRPATDRNPAFWWVVIVWLVIVAVPAAWAYSVHPNFDIANVFWFLTTGVFLFLGVLILANQPRHTVGRLFLTAGALPAIGWMLLPVFVALGNNGSVDAAGMVEAIHHGLTFLWMPVSLMALVLFPTGEFLSSKWRWSLIAFGAAVVLGFLAPFLVGGFMGNAHLVTYPPPWLDEVASTRGLLKQASDAALLASLVLATVALIQRFRASTGVERLQLKWTAFGMAVFAIGSPTIYLVAPDESGTGFWGLLEVVLLMLPFVAMGMAMVRYRLYAIDRVISRTVAYLLVVGLLALVFATGVVWIPQILGLGDSPLLIAGSTLAVAALFNPVRSRVQRRVDMRFNRSRYDAQRVVDRFVGGLHEEVDMGQLASGLTDAVVETLQPSSLGVWIAESG